ncbi:hypothetical protein [Occallatibacter riparius]|nr:hypothetical protein [Occallatibacter riparius]
MVHTIALRSGEFHVINEFLNCGSKLKDLVLTPPLFLWNEDGPKS